MIRRFAPSSLCAGLGVLLCCGLALSDRTAKAAEAEQVVVRNRSYVTDGKLELSIVTGFSMANTFTSMVNPEIDVIYHISEPWSVELLLGYSFGGSTDLLGQAQAPPPAAGSSSPGTSVFKGAYSPGGANKTFSDVPNLWTLNGLNAQVGARWEPIYGKLSLLTELPVHFKWFFDLDAGVAQFSRTSLNYCTNYQLSSDPTAGDCQKDSNGNFETLQENHWSGVGSAGTGLRFIFLRSASLTAGFREYFWLDSYRNNFLASDWVNNPTGGNGESMKHGVTAALFANVGLSWTF